MPVYSVPHELKDMDWASYQGWYDTDVTLPSVYFRPDVERAKDVPRMCLDFTYLYDDSNIDYYRTGPGVRTR